MPKVHVKSRIAFSLLINCVEIATSREKSNVGLYRNILKHRYRIPNRRRKHWLKYRKLKTDRHRLELPTPTRHYLDQGLDNKNVSLDDW